MQRLGVAAANARASTSTPCRRRSTGSPSLHRVRKVFESLKPMKELLGEVILDHYKNPRGHGVIEDADATAEGMNPLCGDEVSIYVAFEDDGETIDEIRSPRSRVCDQPGRNVDAADRDGSGPDGRRGGRDVEGRAVEEIGIPNMSPIGSVRCSASACSRSRSTEQKGTPLPQEWAGLDEEFQVR